MRYSLLLAPMLFFPAALAAQTAPAPAADGATPTSATAPAPADPGQAVQCRRYPVTGSLAQTRRVCRTVAEWNRQTRIGNERARDMVGLGATPDYANPPGGG